MVVCHNHNWIVLCIICHTRRFAAIEFKTIMAYYAVPCQGLGEHVASVPDFLIAGTSYKVPTTNSTGSFSGQHQASLAPSNFAR